MQDPNTPLASPGASAPTMPPQRCLFRSRCVLRPLDSLRVQLAAGSAAVVVGAVVIVLLLALVGANLIVLNSERTTMADEALRTAQALGQGTDLGGTTALPSVQTGTVVRSSTFGSYTIWVLAPSGTLTVRTVIAGEAGNTQDRAAIRTALAMALQGQEHEGLLPSSASWLSALVTPQAMRWVVALPVHAGGGSTGPITEAVALSTPLAPSHHGSKDPQSALEGFPTWNPWLIAGATLVTVLLAVVVAIGFARRLTRPLAQLAQATQELRAGNYATRMQRRAPREIQVVMETFNTMAAAMQANIAQLQDQDRQRRELLEAVAHDLATPLTMIQGYTEALAEGIVHDAARRTTVTRIMGREAARLRRLVDQLRKMALVEAGIVPLQLGPVEVASLMEDTLVALAPAITDKHLTVQMAGLHGLPAIRADPDGVMEVFVNLLENAIRYTPDGGQVTLSGVAADQAVTIHIADTGPGISPADRQRIFERFARLDPTRNTTTGGAGLGLAIVASLVKAQGGTIAVENAPETGACFILCFPRSEAVPA